MAHKSMHRPRPGEEGTILVVAVLIVFLMMVIVTDTTLVADVEWEATSNADLDLQLEFALRGGYEIAKAHLVDDLESAPETDTLLEEWAAPEGIEKDFSPEAAGAGSSGSEPGGENASPKVRIFIEDEERKWPLPFLMVGADTQKARRKEGLVNLLDEFRRGTPLDLDPSTAAAYADQIYNFVTRKENDQGFGPTPRPQTKSGCLLNTTDLTLCPGIPPSILFDMVDDEAEHGEIIPGLLDFVTLWSDMAINVNTASEAVLRGLFRRAEDEASVGSDIYNHREKKSDEWLDKNELKGLSSSERAKKLREREKENREAGTAASSGGGKSGGREGEEEEGGTFEKVEDVKKEVPTVIDRIYNELSPYLTVTSNSFTIWVEARMLGIRKTRRYVVRRSGAAFLLVLSEVVSWPRYRPFGPEEQR